MENLVFTDSQGNEIIYTILFSFDMNEKSYIVYSDSHLESDKEVKVYYGYYEDGDISKLKSVETAEDIKLIDNMLKDYQIALKGE